MDESRYQKLADEAFRRIDKAFADVDPDVVDCERAGDVVTITFPDKSRCIVNTQRPTRQIWVAANARGWHFSYDEARGVWLDDKGAGEELFATLVSIVKQRAAVDIRF
jgi:CyaY protein